MVYEAAGFIAHGIVVGPVHYAAEVVPLVNSPELYAVTECDRYTFSEVDVVCDQQRLAVTQPDNETLVTRAVVVIRQ